MQSVIGRGGGFLFLVTVLVVAGCGPRETAPPPDPSVTNEALGMTLRAVPEDFVVDVNEGDRFELVPANPSVGGRVAFSVGPERDAINLVAVVKRHQQQIEEMPEAEYKGGQELVTPFGTAFYSRGRFLAGMTETEETSIFLKHPFEQRVLTIGYRYPAGADSSIRVQQLLDILALIDAPGAEVDPVGE
jgi:hypothetical protein